MSFDNPEQVYLPALIESDGYTLKTGVEVQQSTVTVDFDDSTIITPVASGTALRFVDALRTGLFDGAVVNLYRVFTDATLNVAGSGGAVLVHAGRVGDLEVGANTAKIKVNSWLERLNTKIPVEVFQAGCRYALFGPGCGLSRSAFQYFVAAQSIQDEEANLVAAGAGTNAVRFSTNSAVPATTDFSLGTITFTSGLNRGLIYPVKDWVFDEADITYMGTAYVARPFLYNVMDGDGITATPGCDKTQTRCRTTFSNLDQYGGFPLVPAPETAV